MATTLSVGKSLDKKLGTLERRLEFLTERISNYHGRSPSHDKAEASALSFAIAFIHLHREDAEEALALTKEARKL